jgi:hypothetical protein
VLRSRRDINLFFSGNQVTATVACTPEDPTAGEIDYEKKSAWDTNQEGKACGKHIPPKNVPANLEVNCGAVLAVKALDPKE